MKELKALSVGDFEIKNNPNKLATAYAKELAENIKEVSEKIDKFREKDLEYNKDYTYFSWEIGNTLADAEVRIRTALDFYEKAKTALDSHKDLVGITENEVVSTEDADKLRDPIFYNKSLKDNPFVKEEGAKDVSMIKDFDLTKKGYGELVSEIATYQKLTKEIKEMIAQPYEKELNDEIKKWKTKIDTSKKKIDTLKIKIKKEYLEKDMVTAVYNPVLKKVKAKTAEIKTELDKYEKERKLVSEYIKTEYLGDNNKDILPETLMGEPGKFSTAKSLDEKLRILREYVSNNSTDKKYRTDDFGDDFRKRNLLNSIEVIFKSKDKKGFLLEERKVAQYGTMKDAVKAFNFSSRKSWNTVLDESVQAEEEHLKTEGKTFLAEEKEKFREKEAKSILEDLNLYIQYHNAEIMLKEIEDRLTLSKKDPGENDNNKLLQAERFTEESLSRSLEKYTEVDYKSQEEGINTEEGTTQPCLFKKNSEDYQKYYMASYKAKEALADLEDIKKILLTSNDKDYDIATDSHYVEEKEYYDDLKADADKYEKDYLKNNADIEASYKKVADTYTGFANVASEVKNKVSAEGRSVYTKLKAVEKKIKSQNSVVEKAQELKERAVKENGLETDDAAREKTKLRLERADKFLQQEEQKLSELKKSRRELENKDVLLTKDEKELAKFRKEALEKRG